MATATQRAEDADQSAGLGEVSLGQKMLSAVSGSILTSLLVTPLDVVRVRLQSQETVPTSSSSQPRVFNGATLTQFRDLPPNMGISASPLLCDRPDHVTNQPRRHWMRSRRGGAKEPSTAHGMDYGRLHRMRGPGHCGEGSPQHWSWLCLPMSSTSLDMTGCERPKDRHSGKPYQMHTPPSWPARQHDPIEMFRTRMQAANHTATAAGHFRETMDGLRTMVGTEGVFSLWRGLTLTLWRDVPFSAIYWWGYEATRNQLIDIRGRTEARNDGYEFRIGRGDERVQRRSRSRSRENRKDTIVDSFVAGAASGAVAAFVTTPFDVGKTRQQVYRHAGEAAKDATKALAPEEQTMPRFLAHIYREQGVSGLFRGWGARCLKIAPACAIMISCYELGKKMATDMNERRERERA
ncbi:hypothetical protein SNOG_15706 [Parastagonospora nodorum SN15]|uniref:Mitochondrial carrier protein n=1 Tax=Phaeosphaeria nodorum (strain SN15 / ATCC MYA-4574 / FGSC 10173) TaxID=321614 RepID=Q0TXE5_PHANO|nr:hypothetical protein SNOG_15706 [Parastagonospora nodorum SN15]EAT76801.2 hypothetical protein SNOG_15706 [Parastagonospora nodorum SN15]